MIVLISSLIYIFSVNYICCCLVYSQDSIPTRNWSFSSIDFLLKILLKRSEMMLVTLFSVLVKRLEYFFQIVYISS